MKVDKLTFFHEGTIRICGSLNIDDVLQRCLDFLKKFMPINGINMSIYETDTGAVRIISLASDIEVQIPDTPIPLSPEGRRFIEQGKIAGQTDKDPVSKDFYNALSLPEMPSLVLPLEIQGHRLGVVVVFTEGPQRFDQEQAQLLELLHDPFAIAMSNTLRYSEVNRLQELLKEDNRYLQQELHRITGDEIIGENFGLRDVMAMVRQVAPMDSQVLLLGETGVGKEVIANALHYSSHRSKGPLVKVNCGAIPENLLDSELFGHEKGAFTGAIERRRGRFERAHNGTIFLDEVGELPPAAQVRLLRVIQDKKIERVGGTKQISLNVRIITATHRNLEEMVRAGNFREDLWFRLNVFPITIPPLRHRRADIPALVDYFIERKVRELKLRYKPVIAPVALEHLQQYNWPGNVRELENAVERELIRSQSSGPQVPLLFDDFKSFKEIPSPTQTSHELSNDVSLNLDGVIRKHIKKVIASTNGKIKGKMGAAAKLGVNPSTLRHRMLKLGIPFGRGVHS